MKDMHLNERLTDKVHPVGSHPPAPVRNSRGAMGFTIEDNRFSLSGFSTIASEEVPDHCIFTPDQYV